MVLRLFCSVAINTSVCFSLSFQKSCLIILHYIRFYLLCVSTQCLPFQAVLLHTSCLTMFLHTSEQQKALPVGLQYGEHDWHFQTVTCSAKCQGACSEVWDVLVLDIALPPYTGSFCYLKLTSMCFWHRAAAVSKVTASSFTSPGDHLRGGTSVSQHCLLLFLQPKGGSGSVKAASSNVTKPIPRSRKG